MNNSFFIRISIFICLLVTIGRYKCHGQENRLIYWHDAKKTKSLEYYRFTDSRNYLDITVKNNTAMSYVVYFPEIFNYPIPIDDLNSPFILNEKNKDSLILHFSGFRTHNLNMIIREISASFSPDYSNVTLKLLTIKNHEEVENKLELHRNEGSDKKVMKDISYMLYDKKNSFADIKENKELKCVNYVDSNIVSAIFLVGRFRLDKSNLMPITFDRKSFAILNEKEINIPDSIRTDYVLDDYSYITKTKGEIEKEKLKLKISYFLYNKNKLMYYCFFYKRKFDDEFYHYGVQLPANP